MKLSRRQMNTLRWVFLEGCDVSELRGLHQMTLWSLLNRRYLQSDGASVTLTKQGKEIMDAYLGHDPSVRKKEQELSDRCARLFKYAIRKAMRKAA